MVLGRKIIVVAVAAATAFTVQGAAAGSDTRTAGKAPASSATAPAVDTAPASSATAPAVDTAPAAHTEPAAHTGTAAHTGSATGRAGLECVRVRGATACVGPDDSDRPGISIEDTTTDRLHPAVEYYLNGYLGTKYVIHNLARKGEARGSLGVGKVVTFRAAIYKGNRRIKVSRWKTVRDVAEHPVKRETRVTPAAARARAEVCTSTKGAASTCFSERKTFVFACDTSADKYQARAEYFVGGDPTARFEIHQLAGAGTCGKAEHGDLSVSMYRASVFNGNRRVATRLYRYN